MVVYSLMARPKSERMNSSGVYAHAAGELPLIEIEVDVSLTPGLPQFHFIGLADVGVRESALRIRAAIRAQGFSLPRGKQILVHLKPSHLKKTSRGLDLAVAAALLWEMGQLPRPSETKQLLYGELSLRGDVIVPDDWPMISNEVLAGRSLITGVLASDAPFETQQVAQLNDLRAPVLIAASTQKKKWVRPAPQAPSFSAHLARLAEIVAAGEHSCLIIGAAGTGKSTLVDSIASFIESPETARVAISPLAEWRPVRRPHHSATPLAMIGGGQNLWRGEISRAHGGVMIMDEFLEFDPAVAEALREPMERGSILISRGGREAEFLAQAIWLATTNLCPCGKFLPDDRLGGCRCSRRTRLRWLERLSGPVADRFQIIASSAPFQLTEPIQATRYFNKNVNKSSSVERVSVAEINERTSAAIKFRRAKRRQIEPNAVANVESIQSTLTAKAREWLGVRHHLFLSQRRCRAVERVARTIADFRQSEEIDVSDCIDAQNFAFRQHHALERWQE